MFGIRHSLHRGVAHAKGFYAIYAALIGAAAAIVLLPGSPLGLLTEGVQVLAGVLLPSASVFLLLLCNDREVLGPWVNGRKVNVFTGAVVAVLVILSVVLTASVLFPAITGAQIEMIMGGGLTVAAGAGAVLAVQARRRVPLTVPRGCRAPKRSAEAAGHRENWRMPPLHLLHRPAMSPGRKLGMGALRVYLAIAMVLVIVRIVQLALGHH